MSFESIEQHDDAIEPASTRTKFLAAVSILLIIGFMCWLAGTNDNVDQRTPQGKEVTR
jgi:hypothetical protein